MNKINFQSQRYYQLLRSLKFRKGMLIGFNGANQQQKDIITSDIVRSKNGAIKLANKHVGRNLNFFKVHSLLGTHSSSILFFDEADALFGKRSEVTDAHDQYANQDVSYLLSTIKNKKRIAIVSLKKGFKKDTPLSSFIDIYIQFPKRRAYSKAVSSFSIQMKK